MVKEKKFIKPKMEIIWFSNDDIITESSGEQVGGDQDIGGIE